MSEKFYKRFAKAVSYTITGINPGTWMSPGQPITPMEQQEKGRGQDYSVGYNYVSRPRSNNGATGGVDFETLRRISETWDLLRLVIETRKDQVEKVDWTVRQKQPKNRKKAGADPEVKQVTDFFEYPDLVNPFATWMRMIMEDLFVIDAPAVYLRKSVGGKILAVDAMDGSMFKVLLDRFARRPVPPSPAYQQFIKGMPSVDYTTDELIYMPRNPRTHKVYGYSPVEQILTTVNIGLRRSATQLDYYTEGNVPEAIVAVPATWTTEQIGQFQAYWDAIIETMDKRKMKFVPGDLKVQMLKEPPLKDEFDEWLARVVCFAFSISPTPFIKQMNKATAGSSQDVSLEEGLQPILGWIKRFMDRLIKAIWPDLDIEFVWQEQQIVDLLEQAQTDQLYLMNAVKSVDEIRERLGFEPVGMPNAFIAGGVVTTIENALNPAIGDIGPTVRVAPGTAPAARPGGVGTTGAPRTTPTSGAVKPVSTQAATAAPKGNTVGNEGGSSKVASTPFLKARPRPTSVGAATDPNRPGLTPLYNSYTDALAAFLKNAGQHLALEVALRYEHDLKLRKAAAGGSGSEPPDGQPPDDSHRGALPWVRGSHATTGNHDGVRQPLDAGGGAIEPAAVALPALPSVGTAASAIVPANIPLTDAQAIADADRLLAGIGTDWVEVINLSRDPLTEAGMEAIDGILFVLEIHDRDITNQPHMTAIQYAEDRSAELVGMKPVAKGVEPPSGALEVDGTFYVENPDAEFAIDETTRSMIKDAVAEILKTGPTVDQLQKAIEEDFAFSESRARTIARTEIVNANGKGSLAAYKAANFKYKTWSTASDDDVDDICIANEEAGPIEMDEPFPSGDQAPTAHPNCHCSVVPYFPPIEPDQE